MEAVPESAVARATELVITQDDQVSMIIFMTLNNCKFILIQGRKVYNNKYVIDRKLVSNTLCKLVIGKLTSDPSKEFILKIWKKQVLRAKKEYHRRKGGHGMVATDQLMKVMESEVRAMIVLAEAGHNPNVVRLYEIIDDEAGFEDKLVLVMEYCSGG